MFQRTITGACAVLFDENCCDTGDTNFVIPRGGKGEQNHPGSILVFLILY